MSSTCVTTTPPLALLIVAFLCLGLTAAAPVFEQGQAQLKVLMSAGFSAAYRELLPRAKGVALTSSTSGVYLTTVLFPRLGIADEMAKKTTSENMAWSRPGNRASMVLESRRRGRTAMALVVFLRGVNVGGHRTFRPSVLPRQLKPLDVVNIGAAGTLVVRGATRQAALRAELVRRLPFEACIAICKAKEIIGLITRDPFAREPDRPGIIRFVSVLSGPSREAPTLPLSLPSDAEWMLRILGREGRFVFGVHRRHMKVIGHLRSLDRLFGVPVTTRSWKTITAIAGVLNDRRS